MVFPNSRAGCSRVPPQSATLTLEYCYPSDPVRLACLIHATSVRSEPESNSQEKNFVFFQVKTKGEGEQRNLTSFVHLNASPSPELVAPHTNIYCSMSLPETHLKHPFSMSDPHFALASFGAALSAFGERGDSISKSSLAVQGGI